MSTGLRVFKAHRNPSAAAAVLVVYTVERETGTVAEDMMDSKASSGFSRWKGMENDMILEPVAGFELWRDW